MPVKPGSPLPPLRDRRTRLHLLAASYLDAAESVNDGVTHGKPQSRAPGRNPELWPHGSYEDFERAFDKVQQDARPWTKAFWKVYVHHGSRLIRGQRGWPTHYELHPVTTTRPALVVDGKLLLREETIIARPRVQINTREAVRAEQVTRMLLDELADSPLYVPAVVAESAGYLPSEAKGFQRYKDA